ncbi:hypothetical protein MJ560_11745 [Klebsiella pneumoniae]|nr:hypothetical protein MJ560_11745 [Klebsiella pneumoniae]
MLFFKPNSEIMSGYVIACGKIDLPTSDSGASTQYSIYNENPMSLIAFFSRQSKPTVLVVSAAKR